LEMPGFHRRTHPPLSSDADLLHLAGLIRRTPTFPLGDRPPTLSGSSPFSFSDGFCRDHPRFRGGGPRLFRRRFSRREDNPLFSIFAWRSTSLWCLSRRSTRHYLFVIKTERLLFRTDPFAPLPKLCGKCAIFLSSISPQGIAPPFPLAADSLGRPARPTKPFPALLFGDPTNPGRCWWTSPLSPPHARVFPFSLDWPTPRIFLKRDALAFPAAACCIPPFPGSIIVPQSCLERLQGAVGRAR